MELQRLPKLPVPISISSTPRSSDCSLSRKSNSIRYNICPDISRHARNSTIGRVPSHTLRALAEHRRHCGYSNARQDGITSDCKTNCTSSPGALCYTSSSILRSGICCFCATAFNTYTNWSNFLSITDSWKQNILLLSVTLTLNFFIRFNQIRIKTWKEL